MDRNLRELARYFPSESWPTLTCPVCKSGALLPKDIALEVNRTTSTWQDWGSPTDIEGTFRGRLECAREDCGESVSVSGDYGVDPEFGRYGQSTGDYVEMFRVRTLYPLIDIATVPDTTPQSVTNALARAAAVVWLEPSLAVTALRTSLERLMDAQDILPKSNNLHNRLVEFKKTFPKEGDLLLAVKYVGNESTHEETEIEAGDVLDMVEFIEAALGVLYAPDHSALHARAERIIELKKMVK